MEKSNTIEFTPSFSGGIVFELKTLPPKSLTCLPEIFSPTCFCNKCQVIWGTSGRSCLPYPDISCSIQPLPRGEAGKGNRIPLSIYYLSHVMTWFGLPWRLHCQHTRLLMQPLLLLREEAGAPSPGLPMGSF